MLKLCYTLTRRSLSMFQDHRNLKFNGKLTLSVITELMKFSLSSRIHRDQPVTPSAKYEIVEDSPTTSKLIIHDVTADDESPIQIKVRNALGESDATVQLKALGKSTRRSVSLRIDHLTLM